MSRTIRPMTARVEFACHPEMHAALKARAVARGVSYGVIARELISDGLARLALADEADARLAERIAEKYGPVPREVIDDTDAERARLYAEADRRLGRTTPTDLT